MNDKKEVRFDQYCSKCANLPVDITGDPSIEYMEDWKHHPEFFKDASNGVCNDCLNHPYNYDSHKPVNFKEAEDDS